MRKSGAIEFRLRAMQLSAVESFLPTAARVVLMKEDPAQFDVELIMRRLHGYTTEEYGCLGCPIRTLCKILETLLQTAQNTLKKLVRLRLHSAVVAVDESLVLFPSFYCR